MKTYRQVPEDAEYREYYDSYRLTVQNLIDTDFLYKTSLSNGQVFFEADEIYGYVHNQPAFRGRNITITSDYINDFVIRDFKIFSRATNELLSIHINCNLANYRDGKPHYLYVVLSHRGTYEVHDDMFQSDETKIVFARFIIGTDGNSIQFYVILPFAGSADYIKGNQFYQVTDGLRLKIVNNSTKQFTLSDAKIRFSGINFDDVSSPDCLEVKFEGATVPIRYVKWDSSSRIPRVDWTAETTNSLNLTKIMNYTTGALSNVPDGKFSIQKLYYDVYTKCIVALYGNKVYNTREAAIYAIDSIMQYPLPDGIEYLIPIAGVILQNTSQPFSDDTIRIINLDYNEQEVLDSDSFTRQQAAEAVQKANQAVTTANNAESVMNEHVGDRTNPHRVRLNQLYNSRGNAVTIDDSYAEWTVSSILAKANENVANTYYLKSGGTISGNVSIGTSSAAKNLVVYGTSTLNGAVSLGGSLSVKGAITTNSTYNIGTSSSRFGTIYSQAINTSGAATIGGALSAGGHITPVTTNTYNLGSTNNRFNYLYARYINLSNDASISGALTVSGAATIGGATTLNGNLTMGSGKRINADNGYIVIGGYSLRLGGQGTIPTQSGYGIW